MVVGVWVTGHRSCDWVMFDGTWVIDIGSCREGVGREGMSE